MCLRFLWDGGRFAIGTNADLNLRGGSSACGAAAAGTAVGDMASSGSANFGASTACGAAAGSLVDGLRGSG